MADKTVEILDRSEQLGYTVVPNVLLHYPGLSPSARLLLIMLRHYAHQSEEAWPGQKRLADDLGLSESTIRRAVRELEERALIETRRRGMGQSLLYRLMPLTGQIDRSRPVPVTAEEREGATAIASAPSGPLLFPNETAEDAATAASRTSRGRARGARPGVHVRTRNLHMDEFALGLGFQLDAVPPAMWSTISKALKEIRAVVPEVTPADVREACERYRRQNPGLEFGPMAVAKWWPRIWSEKQRSGYDVGAVIDAYHRPGATEPEP
jgi:DNA-binding transcriptional ArsR family regulator